MTSNEKIMDPPPANAGAAAGLIAEIRAHFKELYPDYDPEQGGLAQYAQCIPWAHAAATKLTEVGYNAAVFAGTAYFRVEANPPKGKSPFYFGYEFKVESCKGMFENGMMPEVHAWCVIVPHSGAETFRPVLVDMTCGNQKELLTAADRSDEFTRNVDPSVEGEAIPEWSHELPEVYWAEIPTVEELKQERLTAVYNPTQPATVMVRSMAPQYNSKLEFDGTPVIPVLQEGGSDDEKPEG